jgi:hypothetical protein
MSNDRQAVLEAIAFSDDPAIRPADRLKALDLLGQFAAVPDERDAPEEEIWDEIDGFHAMTLAAMRVSDGPELRIDPDRFPRYTAAMRELVNQEVARVLSERQLFVIQPPSRQPQVLEPGRLLRE